MIVADASVAAKWMLDEEGSAAALNLLDAYAGQLRGPDLIVPEVGGAFVRRAIMGELSRVDCDLALLTWTNILDTGALTTFQTTSGRLNAAAQLALMLKHALKDCIYLALAIELGCELVSCDRRLLDKAALIDAKARHLYDF